MGSQKKKEKTDRSAHQDEGAVNFRTTGDGSEWDNGRQASISEGTRVETETRAGDAKTPGPKTKCGPPK